ncbi:N-formylglutamate amidohydrolase (plasmid) [Microvirga sp. RSM25]|uniref:N-formylglutamate amidohydrolase n=1 Tax=Microvirga sp. RSM25 TaxID=3273802 RepID=UPI00384FD2FF
MQEHCCFGLAETDPPPLEVVGEELNGPFFLICEHAGRAIPACLSDLGVGHSDMERHIAYDIGAEEVSRKLSDALCAPLYIQRYSRLVIDCNRPLEASDSIPEISDGTQIPRNFALSMMERRLRYEKDPPAISPTGGKCSGSFCSCWKETHIAGDTQFYACS